MKLIVMHPHYLDLVCLLGTGPQILTCLRNLSALREESSGYTVGALSAIRFLTRRIAASCYYITKLVSAINASNILTFMELFHEKELGVYLSGDQFVRALLLAPKELQYQILRSFPDRNRLLHQLILNCYQKDYCQLLELLLVDQTIAAIIFASVIDIDMAMIKKLLPLLPFIFTSVSCQQLANKTTAFLKGHFHEMVMLDLLECLLNVPQLEEIIADMSVEQFVFLLTSSGVSSSKEITHKILDYLDLFPIKSLLKNNNLLIQVVCKNRYFVAFIFQNWPLFHEMTLLPEELFTILFKEENRNILDYLMQSKQSYFYMIMRNIIANLPADIREQIESRYPLVKTNAANMSAKKAAKWAGDSRHHITEAITFHRTQASLQVSTGVPSPTSKLLV